MYFDVIFGLGIFLVLAFTIVSQIFLDSYRFPQKRIADQGANYVPSYDIDLFVSISFYGTDDLYLVILQLQ